MRPFDVVTFDCYGTLIDWEAGIVEAFLKAAEADGIRLDPAAVLKALFDRRPSSEQPYQMYRERLTANALRVSEQLGWKISRERAAFLPESLGSWRPFPDTNEALRRLSRAGCTLGVLSNVDDDLFEGSRRQLAADLSIIVTAEPVRSYKPAAGHFTTARGRIGERRWLHAAQSYFHDVVPAVAHGIPVAWINRKAEQPTGTARSNWEFKTLTELADWLCAA